MIQNILLVFNIIILESLLSGDNAAVLATMVKDLPRNQQPKALKYGMLGAFVFRGLSLLIAGYLIKVLWLKIIGGLYLLYLVYGHFTPEKDTIEEGIDKDKNGVYIWAKNKIGSFWSTIILVELMDMVFSLDNIFAAVAMSKNIYIVIIGVCIGIAIMRFVAQWFVSLMHIYPSLETSAFIVIGLLGMKLIVESIVSYKFPDNGHISTHHTFDYIFSGIMMIIFFAPLVFKRLNGRKKIIVKMQDITWVPMEEMADDIIEGRCCQHCGEYFIDENGDIIGYGYPMSCGMCKDEKEHD